MLNNLFKPPTIPYIDLIDSWLFTKTIREMLNSRLKNYPNLDFITLNTSKGSTLLKVSTALDPICIFTKDIKILPARYDLSIITKLTTMEGIKPFKNKDHVRFTLENSLLKIHNLSTGIVYQQEYAEDTVKFINDINRNYNCIRFTKGRLKKLLQSFDKNDDLELYFHPDSKFIQLKSKDTFIMTTRTGN